MTPGYKTSEFYVVLAGLGGTLWTFTQAHCSVTEMDVTILAISLVTGGYAALRTWLKSRQQ